MRELKTSSLNRALVKRDFNKIVFIIPEGEVTEIKYFEGIHSCSEYLNINKLIKISLIENEENEKGQSHIKRKISNFEKSVTEGKIAYNKDIDQVVFVIDRDPHNFNAQQYDEALKYCNNKGYTLCVSNPAFELFLLMHDDRIFTLSQEDLLKNRKLTSKRYLEKKVCEFFGHNKLHLDFSKYKDKVKSAIKNEKRFCEDINKLKDSLGSNIGLFLESLIDEW